MLSQLLSKCHAGICHHLYDSTCRGTNMGSLGHKIGGTRRHILTLLQTMDMLPTLEKHFANIGPYRSKPTPYIMPCAYAAALILNGHNITYSCEVKPFVLLCILVYCTWVSGVSSMVLHGGLAKLGRSAASPSCRLDTLDVMTLQRCDAITLHALGTVLPWYASDLGTGEMGACSTWVPC